jgi:hypothetical protein
MNYDFFDNIEYKSVEILFKLCNENKNNLANVKINYSRFNNFLQDNLNFLVELNIISTSDNKIQIEKTNLSFKDFLISKILNSSQYGPPLKEYLNNFIRENQKLVFKPNDNYNSTTSSLRNFLISMDLVKYEINIDQYFLLSDEFLDKLNKIKFSPEELRKQLEKQNQIGLLAEEFVFKIEKEKIHKFDQSLLPEHVSKSDVSAGFDILSYEKNNDQIKKIFIEVKAVSSSNFKFYLSNGEFQTSLKYKDNYFLYLLPVDHTLVEKFNNDNILKINDLENNLFKNKVNWYYENNGYVFYQKILN